MEGIQVSTATAGSQGQVSIIKVGGYIDTTTSSEVERALNSLLKQGRYKIIIDLGNVDYISSAGWGIFISEIKSIRENNGDLKLVNMIPDVYEIFELLEFHHILDVYDSNEEAIQKFEEGEYVEVSSMSSAHAQASEQSYRSDYDAQSRGEAEKSPEATPHMETRDKAAPTDQTRESQTPRDLSSIPLENKIKHIVAQNPGFGAFKINKKLNTLEYGFTKIGWFAVRSMLNKLELNTRASRKEFSQKYLQNEI